VDRETKREHDKHNAGHTGKPDGTPLIGERRKLRADEHNVPREPDGTIPAAGNARPTRRRDRRSPAPAKPSGQVVHSGVVCLATVGHVDIVAGGADVGSDQRTLERRCRGFGRPRLNCVPGRAMIGAQLL
jgi:hypothetical protein